MKCPFCQENNTAVKDSRNTEEGNVTRRRRFCLKCGGRFTTFERPQTRELMVVKRTGFEKPFDRNKIFKSINTALRKRNFSEEQIESLTNKIVLEINSSNIRAIPTLKIGNMIMEELGKIDPVAYIRFASVYKDFATAEDFAKFINKIKRE